VSSVSLEQLIALNREISALAATGVPLSAGLLRTADEFNGETSALARRLAVRIDAGENLAAALDAEGDALPASYRSIVHAGLRCGRLSAALEGYTETASRIAELRRLVGLAAIYPFFLLVAAWILLLSLSSYYFPTLDWLQLDDRIWAKPLHFSLGGGSVWKWLVAVAVPIALVAFAWVAWRQSSGATAADPARLAGWLRWIPGLARVRQLSAEANFADLLRLFVEQRIPMAEAMPLAAQASGLAAPDASSAAQAFQQLPPLVRLALLTNRGPQPLADGLQRAVENYHERAQDWAHSVAFYWPIAATALLGGIPVGIYAFLILQPYVAALYEVANWNSL